MCGFLSFEFDIQCTLSAFCYLPLFPASIYAVLPSFLPVDLSEERREGPVQEYLDFVAYLSHLSVVSLLSLKALPAMVGGQGPSPKCTAMEEQTTICRGAPHTEFVPAPDRIRPECLAAVSETIQSVLGRSTGIKLISASH